ncbi:MAG: DUF2497 domain-containing protein [Parasphingopyxis sp.]
MGDVNHEPTMEEILASIKKIIAEDGDERRAPPRRGGPRKDPVVDSADVLELTDTVEEPAMADSEEQPLLSDDAADAGRTALAMLSTIAREHDETQEAAGSAALEQMVREMIRPMLKDWLDANLPAIIEAMVAREIERITGTGD